MRGHLAVAGLVLLAAVGGCGSEDRSTSSSVQPRFPAGSLLWAQGSTVHVGDRVDDVAPLDVESLAWSPTRLYLAGRDATGDEVVAVWDGEHLEVTDVELGLAASVTTSADGRYAAWVDHHGPWRPGGRLAEVVVEETATREVVLRDRAGMGGWTDDLTDLYEDAPPGVLGFDGAAVWWRTPGDVRSLDLASDEPEVEVHERPGFRPRLPAFQGYRFTSPDGVFRLDAQRIARLRIRPDEPDYGHPYVFFGGWLDDRRFYALARDRFGGSFYPDRPDRTRGTMITCDLGAGTCRDRFEVRRTRSVVFPGAPLAQMTG